MIHKHHHLFYFLSPLKSFPLLSLSLSSSCFSSSDIVGQKNTELLRYHLDTQRDLPELCSSLPAQDTTLSARGQGIKRQSRSLLVGMCCSRAEPVPLTSLTDIFTLDKCTVSYLYFVQMLNHPGKCPGTLLHLVQQT